MWSFYKSNLHVFTTRRIFGNCQAIVQRKDGLVDSFGLYFIEQNRKLNHFPHVALDLISTFLVKGLPVTWWNPQEYPPTTTHKPQRRRLGFDMKAKNFFTPTLLPFPLQPPYPLENGKQKTSFHYFSQANTKKPHKQFNSAIYSTRSLL